MIRELRGLLRSQDEAINDFHQREEMEEDAVEEQKSRNMSNERFVDNLTILTHRCIDYMISYMALKRKDGRMSQIENWC